MADIQTYQNGDNFELKKRGPSLTTTTIKPQEQEEIRRLATDERDPSPSHPGPSTDDFRILIATNCGIGNISLSLADTPDSCLFYVKNGSLRRNTPSVTMTHETRDGPVLGTLKLGYARNNTFGIGDPAKENDIAWENLRRTSEWTHATYEFTYGDERRVYVWQRTKQAVFSDQPNMELRERLVAGGFGEVLAIYKGNQGMMWKSRGRFSISRGLDGGEAAWSGKKGGKWSEFELVILLTGLGIIESSRRRARGRRGAGASGGGG